MTVVDETEYEYAGFWARVGAALIDTLLVSFLTIPLVRLIYGSDDETSALLFRGTADLLISFVLPALAVVAFWVARGATPGKMAISAEVVDARTGNKPSTGQAIGRYLGYYVSTIPFCLGLIWVAFDPKKQGWHDKLAGTVVIRRKGGTTHPVSFERGAKDRAS